MGDKVRRLTWRRSPRTVFWGVIAWTVLALVLVLVVLGFVYVFTLAFS